MKLVFDDSQSEPPGSGDNRVSREEWFDFYRDIAEELPRNMPEPRGRMVTIWCFVDANHTGNSMHTTCSISCPV